MILGSEDGTGQSDSVSTCRACEETLILTHTVAKYVVGNAAHNNVSIAFRFIHYVKSLRRHLSFFSQQIKN